jgi:hypothetical protein
LLLRFGWELEGERERERRERGEKGVWLVGACAGVMGEKI